MAFTLLVHSVILEDISRITHHPHQPFQAFHFPVAIAQLPQLASIVPVKESIFPAIIITIHQPFHHGHEYHG